MLRRQVDLSLISPHVRLILILFILLSAQFLHWRWSWNLHRRPIHQVPHFTADAAVPPITRINVWQLRLFFSIEFVITRAISIENGQIHKSHLHLRSCSTTRRRLGFEFCLHLVTIDDDDDGKFLCHFQILIDCSQMIPELSAISCGSSSFKCVCTVHVSCRLVVVARWGRGISVQLLPILLLLLLLYSFPFQMTIRETN